MAPVVRTGIASGRGGYVLPGTVFPRFLRSLPSVEGFPIHVTGDAVEDAIQHQRRLDIAGRQFEERTARDDLPAGIELASIVGMASFCLIETGFGLRFGAFVFFLRQSEFLCNRPIGAACRFAG